MTKEMTKKALEARRQYQRNWNAANKDKVKAYQARYWEKFARKGDPENDKNS